MDVLITGASGQLGRELQRILAEGKSELGEIPAGLLGCKVTATDVGELDITDAASVESFFSAHSFSYAFNCAAMTNVDACEDKEALAERINAEGPRILAKTCVAHDCRLVHVSTDYVFSGNGRTVPYSEEDAPDPLSAYGRTKLDGEHFVLAEKPDSVICRTAWLYGYEGNNFPKKIMKLAREKGALSVVTDQKGNPTCAVDLAYEMVQLAVSGQKGIFHCTCNGEAVSRYEFTKEILADAGIPCVLKPCRTEDFPRKAHVPSFSGLSKRKLSDLHLNFMRDWKTALASWMRNYLKMTEEKSNA